MESARATHRLAPGTKFGADELVGLVGSGGMGDVYRARDPRLQREVAIKVLPRSFASDPERVRRFEQEARPFMVSEHGTTIVYACVRTLSTLYLVEGLQ